jgi:cyclase
LTIVDAAIPEGAADAFRAIRGRSALPFARVIDTHYHLDHLYGNAFWSDRGAEPIAFRGLAAELAAAEPELFGGGPGLWQQMTPKLPSLAASRPLEPLYASSGTVFEAAARPISLLHPGIAHTHSDAVVWLPNERVLFTGDLVANGPFNAVADSTIGSWITVLDSLRALRPAVVVPGHGLAGGPELIDRQQGYFRAVTAAVDAMIASGSDPSVAIPAMRAQLLATPATAHFVNDHHLAFSGFFMFHDLAAKIYHERTGKQLARIPGAPPPARCCGDLVRSRRLA